MLLIGYPLGVKRFPSVPFLLLDFCSFRLSQNRELQNERSNRSFKKWNNLLSTLLSAHVLHKLLSNRKFRLQNNRVFSMLYTFFIWIKLIFPCKAKSFWNQNDSLSMAPYLIHRSIYPHWNSKHTTRRWTLHYKVCNKSRFFQFSPNDKNKKDDSKFGNILTLSWHYMYQTMKLFYYVTKSIWT